MSIIITASNAGSVKRAKYLCMEDKKLLVSLFFEEEREGLDDKGKNTKTRKCRNCGKKYLGNSGNSNYLSHVEQKILAHLRH